MRRSMVSKILWSAGFVCFAFSSIADDKISISCELYHVSTEFTTRMKANGDYELNVKPTGTAFFNELENLFDVGKTRIDVSDSEIAISGQPIEENDAVKKMAAPSILTLAGREARVSITQEIPFEVMKPVESKSGEQEFEQDIVHVEQGLNVTITPQSGSDPNAIVLDVKITFSVPDGNQKLEGAELEAGPVVMRKRMSEGTFRLKPDTWMSRLMGADDDSGILVFTKAIRVESE